MHVLVFQLSTGVHAKSVLYTPYSRPTCSPLYHPYTTRFSVSSACLSPATNGARSYPTLPPPSLPTAWYSNQSTTPKGSSAWTISSLTKSSYTKPEGRPGMNIFLSRFSLRIRHPSTLSLSVDVARLSIRSPRKMTPTTTPSLFLQWILLTAPYPTSWTLPRPRLMLLQLPPLGKVHSRKSSPSRPHLLPLSTSSFPNTMQMIKLLASARENTTLTMKFSVQSRSPLPSPSGRSLSLLTPSTTWNATTSFFLITATTTRERSSRSSRS